MPRTKERPKHIHQASVVETLFCLASMPHYAAILAKTLPDKDYAGFLGKLLQADFYSVKQPRLTVKQVAIDTNEKDSKVTKWVHKIYEDILELLYERPALFKTDGTILTSLRMKYFDSYCCVKLYLPVIPRKGEIFSYDFSKAKTGTYRYHVKSVTHELNDGIYEVWIELSGDYENEYREMLLQKALFYNRIGFLEPMRKSDSEIDELLKNIYRG